MARTPICFLATAWLACAPGLAGADELLIQAVESAQSTAAERPARGTSMDSVAKRWGEPQGRQPAVGKPPITRWDYPGFIVYFEYNHVIDAVPRL